MRMWVVGLLVAILACLTYVEPVNSLAEDPKPADELYGFDEEIPRDFVNKNIHFSFRSYYQYLAISYCFSRHNVSLPGFERLFRSYSNMELQNAERLMEYMVKRGMTFDFHSIHVTNKTKLCYDRDDIGETAREYVQKIMTFTIKDQKSLLKRYQKTHTAANSHNFPHLKHFIEDEFMDQKYTKIKELADIKTLLKKGNSGFDLYMFDRSLM